MMLNSVIIDNSSDVYCINGAFMVNNFARIVVFGGMMFFTFAVENCSSMKTGKYIQLDCTKGEIECVNKCRDILFRLNENKDIPEEDFEYIEDLKSLISRYSGDESLDSRLKFQNLESLLTCLDFFMNKEKSK